MNTATAHRGPDGTGVFFDEHISFGHNLLAITEAPAQSLQPFVSKNKQYALVFNGEIYNYQALREGLQRDGDIFTTQSDTEVLFNGLIRYGTAFIPKLDGMFAFAFYDKRKGTILLARDNSGIKPLYYYHKDDVFIFSSELRGIFAHNQVSRRLEYDAVNMYFVLGYVTGEKTLVKNINKVCGGQILEYDIHKKILQKQWFALEPRAISPQAGQSLSARFRANMHNAVALQTQGLRPLGLYLSGGLDSTMIFHEWYSLVQEPIQTFTTRFDVDFGLYNSDADIAAKVAKEYGAVHQEILVTEKKFVDTLSDTIFCMEEPRWSPYTSEEWIIAKEASKKITVVMCGHGGDELFLGYRAHRNSRRIARYYKKYPKRLLDIAYTLYGVKKGRIQARHMLALSDIITRWAYVRGVFHSVPKNMCNFPYYWDIIDVADAFRSLRSQPVQQPLDDEENAFADFDRLFWLGDEVITRTDKISMYFGMEGRFPILANDMQRFANGIPSDKKMVGRSLKHIAREAYKGYLPEYITSKKKTGWKAPVTLWMDSLLGDMVQEVLSRDFYTDTASLFALPMLQQAARTKQGEYFTSAEMKQFMPVVSFQIWAQRFGIQP